MTKAEDYINRVLKGKETVSKWIELAVERHVKDIKDGEKRGIYFDEAAGEQWVRFAEICHYFDDQWAGKKVVLEPHQAFYFYSSMGWKRSNGARRYRRCYKKIARKNGKSTEEAIRLLGHLFLDDLQGAQGFCAANKEDQAKIVLNMAGQIARQTPALNKHLQMYESRGIIGRIIYYRNNSYIEAIGSDSKRQDGRSPSWVSYDEWHEAKSDSLLNVLESGMGARTMPGPMTDIITTAGFNKEGPCYHYEQYCKDVLEGKLQDDNIYALIFDQDEESEWDNLPMWKKSNPNIGVSVFPEFLEARFNEAVNMGGTKEVDFKTKNLNIWTNASSVWIKDEVWRASSPGIDKDILKGKECYIGLDLAKKLDINALSIFFPNAGTNENGKVSHATLKYFFIPKQKKDKDNDHVDYYRWIDKGFIEEIGEYSIDFRDLGPRIAEILKDYDVKVVGFDRRYAHDGTVRDLQERGYECVEVPQTSNYLHLPTIELEKMVIEGTLEHYQNPVLRWMVSNVELFTDSGGSVRADKAKSKGKIDGVAALINAIFVWMAMEKEEAQEVKIEFW